jgi:hypothetical protein
MTPCSDIQLRAMRDAIYQCTCKDWDAIEKFWRADEKWLTEQYNKKRAVSPRFGDFLPEIKKP